MKLRHALAGTVLLLAAAIPATASSSDTVLTPQTFINVAKQVLPGVVSIEVKVLPSQEFLDKHNASSMEDLLRQMEERALQGGMWDRFNFDADSFGHSGSGSGVIVDQQDGWAYLLTNRHVVEENPRAEYFVTLDSSYGDDTMVISGDEVELVGSDELTDLAVLKFKIPEGITVPEMRFANSDTVEVGEWVLALGSPLALNNSISQGIVSAKNRDISSANRIENLLQTTAIINPGNSGGPLVNLDGEVVGINNAIKTTTGRWEGFGFAIPANQAKRVSKMLIDEGKVTRGFLGITMEDMRGKSGVAVTDVRPDTPAEAVGIQVGDVVSEVDGEKIRSSKSLLMAIGNRMAGDEVNLKIVRSENGSEKEMDFNVALAERPSEEELMSPRAQLLNQMEKQTPAESDDTDISQLGFTVEPDKDATFSGMRVTEVRPRSSADRAGLRTGDLLVQINGVFSTSQQKMNEGLNNVSEGESHIILFRRDGSNQFVTIDQGDR